MIDHFEFKVRDVAASAVFYGKVLEPVGVFVKWQDKGSAGFGCDDNPDRTFILIEQGEPGQKLHICFSATSKEQVERFHQLGMEHDFRCNGKPGYRKDYCPGYYAAFLLDPDGHNIEVLFRENPPKG